MSEHPEDKKRRIEAIDLRKQNDKLLLESEAGAADLRIAIEDTVALLQYAQMDVPKMLKIALAKNNLAGKDLIHAFRECVRALESYWANGHTASAEEQGRHAATGFCRTCADQYAKAGAALAAAKAQGVGP